jgi:adenine/guanine phosphoribosyltransferase-like PRPP-binding protein
MLVHPFLIFLGTTKAPYSCKLDGDFYSWLAKHFSDQENPTILLEETICVTYSNEQISDSRCRDLYYDLHASISALKKIRTNSIIIIDIEAINYGQLRGGTLEQILDSVYIAIKSMHERPRHVIFLFKDMMPTDDTYYKNLKNISEVCEVTQFNQHGEHDSRSIEILDLEFSKRNRLRRDPTRVIKDKMIRHVGHFEKSSGARVYCSSHFYDGRYCEKELSDIIFIRFCDIVTADSVLGYHSKHSPWLIRSIESLDSKLKCNIVNLCEEPLPENMSKFFIVVDFLDSGSTLLSYIEDCGRNPDGILAILATQDENCKNNTKLLRRKGHKNIEVEYLIEAAYSKSLPSHCLAHKLGIPYDTLDNFHVKGKLRSLDFWYMAKEAGVLNEEDNPPDWRRPLTKTIDTKNMVEIYGSYLAYRILQLYNFNKISPDTTIVCPDDEYASSKFADKLLSLVSPNIIKIPKSYIKQAEIDIENLDFDDNIPAWVNDLQKKSVKICLVIDDISVSGSTLIGMRNILIKFEKEILGFIPIINFDPNLNIKLKELLLPLYEWNGLQHA